MSSNQFLLPDELGWECNDELSELVITKLQMLAELAEKSKADSSMSYGLLKVGVAEILDEVYAIIKRYQAKI